VGWVPFRWTRADPSRRDSSYGGGGPCRGCQTIPQHDRPPIVVDGFAERGRDQLNLRQRTPGRSATKRAIHLAAARSYRSGSSL
jgi:hypothetical protein